MFCAIFMLCHYMCMCVCMFILCSKKIYSIKHIHNLLTYKKRNTLTHIILHPYKYIHIHNHICLLVNIYIYICTYLYLYIFIFLVAYVTTSNFLLFFYLHLHNYAVLNCVRFKANMKFFKFSILFLLENEI